MQSSSGRKVLCKITCKMGILIFQRLLLLPSSSFPVPCSKRQTNIIISLRATVGLWIMQEVAIYTIRWPMNGCGESVWEEDKERDREWKGKVSNVHMLLQRRRGRRSKVLASGETWECPWQMWKQSEEEKEENMRNYTSYWMCCGRNGNKRDN